MNIDLHAKAVQLLEKVANSVHERENANLLCFSINEIQLVKKWLEDFVEEAQKEKPN